MTYLLCALLGGGVIAAICVPLFRKENTLESAILEETEWDLLLRKKERLLANIQDLDFEYKCGKLSETDYTQVRREMANELGTVLDHVHHLEKSLDLDALIRREVAARKDASPKGAQAQNICPSCSFNNPPKNKFCAECGAKLNS
jgi:DNA repair exonuclease SbcCD ATPase subunit